MGTTDAISQCQAMVKIIKTTLRWRKREIGESRSKRLAFHPPGSNLWQMQCSWVGLGRWWVDKRGWLSKFCTRPANQPSRGQPAGVGGGQKCCSHLRAKPTTALFHLTARCIHLSGASSECTPLKTSHNCHQRSDVRLGRNLA